MMELLDNMISMKTVIQIKWSFEVGDDDMQDLGLYYQDLLRCPVQVIEVTKFDF